MPSVAEYKRYHGLVLAELVQQMDRPVMIHELSESGRLSSYLIDDRVGLYVKHSTNRMGPWQFTFTASNLAELNELQGRTNRVFITLVCGTEGLVTLSIAEFMGLVVVLNCKQAWVRASKRPGRWFGLSGSMGGPLLKRPSGLHALLDWLNSDAVQRSLPFTSSSGGPSLLFRTSG
jgi:hypothetical protein